MTPASNVLTIVSTIIGALALFGAGCLVASARYRPTITQWLHCHVDGHDDVAVVEGAYYWRVYCQRCRRRTVGINITPSPRLVIVFQTKARAPKKRRRATLTAVC